MTVTHYLIVESSHDQIKKICQKYDFQLKNKKFSQKLFNKYKWVEQFIRENFVCTYNSLNSPKNSGQIKVVEIDIIRNAYENKTTLKYGLYISGFILNKLPDVMVQKLSLAKVTLFTVDQYLGEGFLRTYENNTITGKGDYLEKIVEDIFAVGLDEKENLLLWTDGTFTLNNDIEEVPNHVASELLSTVPNTETILYAFTANLISFPHAVKLFKNENKKIVDAATEVVCKSIQTVPLKDIHESFLETFQLNTYGMPREWIIELFKTGVLNKM